MEKQNGKAEVKRRGERVRRKKMQVREKVAKSRNIAFFFPMFWGSGGSKSRLAKAAGAAPLGRWEMKNSTPLWREADSEVKNTTDSEHFWKLRCWKSRGRCGAKHISKSKVLKTEGVRSTFGSWAVEKVPAVVAQSTFRSQNVQNTPVLEHFWKLRLRCWKSAGHSGGKHISKWTC